MKCNDIQERLSPYIDEVLAREEMEEITDHLANCESCGKIYQNLLGMIGTLNAIGEVELPDSFEYRLRHALSEERKARSKVRINWRYVSSIAAVFTIGLLTYGLYSDMLQILPAKLDQGGSIDILQEDTALHSRMTEAENLDLYEMDPAGIIEGTAAEEQKIAASADAGETGRYELSSTMDSYSAAGNTSEPAGRIQETKEQDGILLENQGLIWDSAAVKYYRNLIKEKLSDYEYELYDCIYETASSEWHFKAVILKDAEGNTYDTEVLITGKNGEITFESDEEIKGL